MKVHVWHGHGSLCHVDHCHSVRHLNGLGEAHESTLYSGRASGSEHTVRSGNRRMPRGRRAIQLFASRCVGLVFHGAGTGLVGFLLHLPGQWHRTGTQPRSCNRRRQWHYWRSCTGAFASVCGLSHGWTGHPRALADGVVHGGRRARAHQLPQLPDGVVKEQVWNRPVAVPVYPKRQSSYLATRRTRLSPPPRPGPSAVRGNKNPAYVFTEEL
nr:uncharacterized protein LOC113829603 [Penaeus vannamei]